MHPTKRSPAARLSLWIATCVVGLCVLGFSASAHAAPSPSSKLQGSPGGNFGVGVMLGQPVAVTFKYFAAREHAVQGALGWGYLLGGRVHVDYAYHPGTFVSNSTLDLIPYVGIGGGMGLFHHNYHWWHAHGHSDGNHAHPSFFLRAPVLGMTIHWQKVPMDTFIEGAWAPALIVGHGSYFQPINIDMAIGARWYF